MILKVKHFFADYLRLLWMIFFRPVSFHEEITPLDSQQKTRLAVKLVIVTAITPFMLTALIGGAFEVCGITFNFTHSLRGVGGVVAGILAFVLVCVGVILASVFVDRRNNTREDMGNDPSLITMLAILIFGSFVAFVVARAITGSAIGGIGVLVVFFAAFGSRLCLVLVTASVLQAMTLLTIDEAVGDYRDTFYVKTVDGAIASVVVLGVVFGFAFDTEISLLPLSTGGKLILAIKALFAIGFASLWVALSWEIGFRIPLFIIEVINSLFMWVRALRQPHMASRFLHQSLAYWDEVMLIPQPLLWRLVVAAGKQDREAGQEAINHLLTHTHQKRAAERAMIELDIYDLQCRDTAEKIAERGAETSWLASINPGSERLRGATEAFTRCENITREIAAAVAATSNYQKLASFNRARRQLDDLTKFAVLRLRRQSRQTFTRIARQWLEVVNAEIDRLTQEEQVAERIPNPYTPLDPLRSGSDIFLGRANAYRFIEEHFLREGRSATIVLYGQRRIGKSSVLRNLDVRLTTNLIPVYVDMQRSAAVESTGGLLFNLADAISRALIQRGVRLKQPALNNYLAEPFIVFGKFLDEVEEAIKAPENRLVLALDEFEVIEDKLTTGKVSLDLMPFLRNMMQHRRGFSLIFAGTHTLDEMISDYWIPYFNTAVPLRVSYLDEASARKLVTQPIEDFPLKYEPEAVDLLIEQTRCHPCLIQLTCQALVDMKNQQRSRHATVEDVEQALNLALENDYALRSLWDWVPGNERPLLAHLASAEPASIKQMARALSEPEAKTRAMAEHLVKAEILMREGEEPVYRFQVPLFRRWVARHAMFTGMEFDQRQAAIR